MKYLKVFGLGWMAVPLIVLLSAASPARATVLCETTTTPCSAAYPAGTEINASLKSGTSMKFWRTEGSGWNTCIGSTLIAKTSNAGGSTETVGAEVGKANFAWGECAGTFETLAAGPIEIHHITGTDSGTVTIKALEATWKFFPNDCAYGSSEAAHLGTLTGGEHPILDVEVLLSRTSGGGLACPPDLIMEASYAVTGPQPLYVEPS
jgi:hypothetical protein